MIMSSKREAVSAAPLFAGLNDAELELLCNSLSEKEFRSGESLFEQGDVCQGLFLLVKGSVKIFRRSDDGSDMMVSVESAPAAIAELPLFDGGPYPASAIALEPVSAYFICKQDFYQFCIRNPQVSLKVLATIGKRLRHLLDLFERISTETLRQRLAKALLDQSMKTDGNTHTVGESIDELANNLNSVREVIARHLASLQDAGAISINGTELRIVKREYLERMASGQSADAMPRG
jgi:CRP/FNR family transcriptional regulator